MKSLLLIMGSLRQLYWQQRMERRELTKAAKIIQNAYRQHRRSRQQQLDLECRAAVIIQTYYRRYKEYCYSKKLNHAASLIQRQFRLYKTTKRKNIKEQSKSREVDLSDDIDSNSSLAKFTQFLANTSKSGSWKSKRSYSMDLDNPALSCFSACDDDFGDAKHQQAALRIQHAFRNHCKRKIRDTFGPEKKSRRLSAASILSSSTS